MKGKISKRSVDALQIGELLIDTEIKGFIARRLPSGAVTFGFRYWAGGKRRWLPLGLHGAITSDQARAKAERERGKVAADRDPLAEREAEKAAVTGRATLANVVPKYLKDRKPSLRATTYADQVRYLERYWLPLHSFAIADIKRENVVTVVDTIAEDHGPVAADRARTSLSALFSWAIDKSYCDANPTANIKARNENGSRTRVLTEAELVEVWNACGKEDHGRIVQLLILTGQRKAEIGGLSWPEIDAGKRQVDLSPERTKNGLPHIVPLSDQARAILAAVERQKGRERLFGSGAHGFNNWAHAKAKLDERIAPAREAAGLKECMQHWTLHDIRRSVVTHLHEHGFAQPHIVEAIVNHVSGHRAGVAGVYNKAQYLAERRQALDLWGQHIAALVKGRESNVIPMPTRRESA